jgi:hypothetical protein
MPKIDKDNIKLPVDYTVLHWTDRKIIREEYVRIQNGLCSHCGMPLTDKPPKNILNMKINRSLFPPNFFKYNVHLHHCHKTGMTIGAVHAYCNAVLWQHFDE